MSKVVNENSTAMCAACDTDLSTCDTIWAAHGILYCSKECGMHDLKHDNLSFEDAAEEIGTLDIGIQHLTNPTATRALHAYCVVFVVGAGLTKPCKAFESYGDMVACLGFDPVEGE